MPVQTYTFAVYNLDDDPPFDAFLLEVPTTQSVDAAARRAWWSAFHRLGPSGIEPEQFQVCQWVDNAPGRLVTFKTCRQLTGLRRRQAESRPRRGRPPLRG